MCQYQTDKGDGGKLGNEKVKQTLNQHRHKEKTSLERQDMHMQYV